MGDVSSCLLGFIFAGLAFYGDKLTNVSLLIWFILLSVFIMDATLTLIKRVITGEQWYTAHRGHAYQRLIQLGVSHSQLVWAVFFINVCLLWPVACVAYKWPALSFYVVIIVAVVMFALWSMIQISYHRAEGTAL
jgi:Fuc2NAc and GlcNAc transferase